jgi:hypothetical protein
VLFVEISPEAVALIRRHRQRPPARRVSARRLVVAVIALAALAAPASAGAFNNTDIDVDSIPRLPCGDRPLPNDTIWCGRWETDQPVGPLATFEPLGVITLDLISQPNAQAVEGKPFGAFNYTSKCTSSDAHNFAGTYRGSGSTTGDAGRILACSQGTTLYGTYRSQELENAGNTFPGSGLRSGEFTITHNLGGAAAAFTGTILQHFSATVPWTGRCVSSTCQGELPAQPPIVGPALFRIRGFSQSPEIRSAADGVTRRMEVGWLVGAGDRLTAAGSLRIGGRAFIQLEAIPGGARFEVRGTAVQDTRGNNIPTPAVFEAEETPILRQGEATVTTTGAQTQSRSTALQGAELLTPVSRVSMSGGVATVTHDPRRRLTTVGNVRGSASVTPTNPALKGLRLPPGRGVEVTRNSITPPFALVPGGSGAPDLRTVIPSPREVRAGPAIATAPSRLSLRSLRGSKCVRVAVTSARPARVLVTIFSGRRSVRLFGQRLVVFAAAGRTSTCIPVPARARTFDVRTPLRFAVGYALGARARSGERPTRPVVRTITLVP